MPASTGPSFYEEQGSAFNHAFHFQFFIFRGFPGGIWSRIIFSPSILFCRILFSSGSFLKRDDQVTVLSPG